MMSRNFFNCVTFGFFFFLLVLDVFLGFAGSSFFGSCVGAVASS